LFFMAPPEMMVTEFNATARNNAPSDRTNSPEVGFRPCHRTLSAAQLDVLQALGECTAY